MRFNEIEAGRAHPTPCAIPMPPVLRVEGAERKDGTPQAAGPRGSGGHREESGPAPKAIDKSRQSGAEGPRWGRQRRPPDPHPLQNTRGDSHSAPWPGPAGLRAQTLARKATGRSNIVLSPSSPHQLCPLTTRKSLYSCVRPGNKEGCDPNPGSSGSGRGLGGARLGEARGGGGGPATWG